ncbi:hypothetical protein [Mycolicibacterium goodii]|uniref:hypothetical protein n=1 Tax=Mycolicibacterium goodii TaxID=134601 RepID=UPI001BDC1B97|nr:hypothetical protein [Mycolicibacterium goodii]MBU8830820.1 hypothetical protein [Mycolicibacterium goodii]
MAGWIVETIASPAPATIGISGGQPVIEATQNVLIQPAPAQIAITGGQPLSGPLVTPGGGEIAIVGGQPVVSQARIITPEPASMPFAGGQPVVRQNIRPTPAPAIVALTGGQPTVRNVPPVTFDAIGPGASRSAGGTSTFNHTAALGADVYLAVSWDRSGGSITGATYGGVAMNLIATMYPNNTTGNGGVHLYHLAGAGNGSSKAATYTASGIAWYTGNIISLANAPAPGTPITAYGSGTTASQTLTVDSGLVLQIVASGNGGGGASDYTRFSGVANRWHNATSGTAMAINTITASGTTSSTSSGSQNWAIISVPLT